MYLIDDEEEIAGKGLAANPSQTLPTLPKAADASEDFPLEFKRAFRLVTEHYRCGADEVALMKEAVKRDREAAVQCFMAMERGILGPAKGINERIRDAIAKKNGDMAVTSQTPIGSDKATARSPDGSTSGTDAQ